VLICAKKGKGLHSTAGRTARRPGSIAAYSTGRLGRGSSSCAAKARRVVTNDRFVAWPTTWQAGALKNPDGRGMLAQPFVVRRPGGRSTDRHTRPTGRMIREQNEVVAVTRMPGPIRQYVHHYGQSACDASQGGGQTQTGIAARWNLCHVAALQPTYLKESEITAERGVREKDLRGSDGSPGRGKRPNIIEQDRRGQVTRPGRARTCCWSSRWPTRAK